jgi:hypothetical protein
VQRLQENAEVVGADEAFFDDEANTQKLVDLYHEKAGILDGDADNEVDLASYAYQIWKNATEKDPSLAKTIEDLPGVVHATRQHDGTTLEPEGALVYLRTAEANDALAWVNRRGESVTQSQLAILLAAECGPDEPPRPTHELHHKLVQAGVEHLVRENASAGGQLGRRSSARSRTYHRLKVYADEAKGTLFESRPLDLAIQEIYDHPLKQKAVDALNRQIKSGADDAALADLVLRLREEDNLCHINEDASQREPHIICSMGLFSSTGGN